MRTIYVLRFVDFLESICRAAEEMTRDPSSQSGEESGGGAAPPVEGPTLLAGLETKLPALLSPLLLTWRENKRSLWADFFADPPAWLLVGGDGLEAEIKRGEEDCEVGEGNEGVGVAEEGGGGVKGSAAEAEMDSLVAAKGGVREEKSIH